MSETNPMTGVLYDLSKAMAEERSIPVVFPGQDLPAGFKSNAMHAIVFNSIASNRRASIGTPALWEIDHELTVRIYVPLMPAISVQRARSLADRVVRFWRSGTSGKWQASTITNSEFPPDEGRYIIEIIVTYQYHEEE